MAEMGAALAAAVRSPEDNEFQLGSATVELAPEAVDEEIHHQNVHEALAEKANEDLTVEITQLQTATDGRENKQRPTTAVEAIESHKPKRKKQLFKLLANVEADKEVSPTKVQGGELNYSMVKDAQTKVSKDLNAEDVQHGEAENGETKLLNKF